MRTSLGLFALGIVAAACSKESGFIDPKPEAGTEEDAGEVPVIPPSDAAPVETGGPPIDKCKVPPNDDNGGGLDCTQSAPPNSFTPKIKWSWTATGGSGYSGSITTPLVGNFTDDDKNGVIDLCDMPDVLVETWAGQIVMLNGATGKEELTFEGTVDGNINFAFGDVDNDGLPEVVAADTAGHVVIYDHKGKIQTTGVDVGTWKQNFNSYCHAFAIYDLDADGTPEIIGGFDVFDNKGKRKFYHDVSSFSGQYWCPANIAADLDGDGKLEVIFGNAAYHANGTKMWSIPGPPGQPQVANLDSDADPEIFVARMDGLLILEHDGKIKTGPYKPVSEPDSPNCWSKPAAIHDFDGDGIVDLTMSTCLHFGILKLTGSTLSVKWQQDANDTSGLASSTAFDFLGKGYANGVYGDQIKLYIYDGKTGNVLLNTPRSSGTLIEYPVVADVDNDQSADIVVVSNGSHPYTVDVVQDDQKRWIPTRRIWNQHAYHVTNVREDGTIPKNMVKNWTKQNTFRTNAQINGDGICTPPPPEKPK